jgi:hypothetical protein
MNWERHFRDMNRKARIQKSPLEYSKEYSIGFGADFGAMQRGIPVPGQPAGTVVIPPGRYWLDTFGPKRDVFNDWVKSKPEVHVETTEDEPDNDPPHTFTIFTIPKGVNNFNLEGLWFPTTQLGFPTIAPLTGPGAVNSGQDTVSKPDAPTSTDIMKEIADSIGQVTKAGATGLGLPPIAQWPWVKIAIIGGAVIAIATLPSALLKHAATKAL